MKVRTKSSPPLRSITIEAESFINGCASLGQIENPEETLDYQVIFSDELHTLRLSYLQEAEEIAQQRANELITFLSGQGKLDDEAETQARLALDKLKDNLGYHEASLLEVLYSIDFIAS